VLIKYSEKTKTFHLFNKEISYIISIEEDKYLSHYYFGKRLKKIHSSTDYPRRVISHFSNPDHIKDNKFTLGVLPQEYPGAGIGDHRESAYKYIDKNGYQANLLEYDSYSITKGKKDLEGLPNTYITDESQAETLEITLVDKATGMEVTLFYTVFEDLPIITRSAKFYNNSNVFLKLNRALSMSLDIHGSNFDLIQLPGAWGREQETRRSSIVRGIHKLDSKRGTTSHTYQPFIGLAKPETNEETGEIYGFHFIYSGEFIGNIEVDAFDSTRIQMGINPEHFQWDLRPNKSFQTPEVVLTYSDKGLNGMSRNFHYLYQNHLIRGQYQYKERPILFNHWESTRFNYTEKTLLEMADEASNLGIELFVIDDGWFGKRENETSSLGDWYVNTDKLPSGLKYLSDAVHEKGMKFGLWLEPEMISEDSELYRKHPDWHIHTPERPFSRGRNQLILDFSRKEVRENILQQLKTILDNVSIDYIKWDYNRNMTELIYGETAHRYILGLYEILEELTASYPNILFENCSGGGGRFDPGMLYYMPQTWTSDNTDAIERLKIQYGTSLTMPISSMGAHVSGVPNHQINRHTNLKLRGDVSSSGNLGYELDIRKLSDEEKKEIKNQITHYKKYRKLIQFGDFYRILSPYEGNNASWIFVDKNKTQAIYMYFQILDKANKPNTKIKLTGLDEEKVYILDDGRIFGGDELMYRGVFLNPNLTGDFQSKRIVLKEYY